MSSDFNKWEADIRNQIHQHEFEFDPQAWAQMDALLEQTAIATTSASSSSITLFWKIIAGALIGAGIITLTIFRQPNSTPKPALSNFTIIATDSTGRSTDAPSPTTEQNASPAQKPAQRKIVVAPSLPKDVIQSDVAQDTIVPLLQIIPPFEALPTPRLHPLIIPETDSIIWHHISPTTQRRKRDKRTLFPDVIENY